jgi:hypothetical protein
VSASTPSRAWRYGLFATLGLLALALVQPVQEKGCTQTSQLALTRAFAAGTARIDRWQLSTCDKAWFQGHYYSVKAPGLAAVALPPYLLLRTAHLLPSSDRTTIWLLGLFTVLPAALLLAFSTASAAELVDPGSGVIAAAVLGVGTLALPFGTLWFGHIPAAALGFSAFVLLLRSPRERAGLRRAALAGFAAGAAVLFEYPLAMLAGALLIYAFVRRGWRSAALFLCGSAVPALALLAYNRWAFGSFGHFSYKAAVIVAGNSGHDVIGANDAGFFGITWPSLSALALLLFSPRGLLALTPVCLLGVIGIALLRRRFAAEALLAAAVVVLFLAYNAGYRLSFGGPFGGDSPGPRFLIAVLPFLVFPVGLAARALPGITAALLGASAAAMVLATVTEPMVGAHETDRWLTDLRHGEFTHTVYATLGGGVGWLPIAPFVVLCAILVGFAIQRVLAGAPDRMRVAFEAACALVAWLLVLYGSAMLYEHQRNALGLLLFALAAVMLATAISSRIGTARQR